MSDFERETRTTTTVETPPSDSVTYVRSGGGAGPWILAAVVAVIAIIAVVWLMNSRTAPTNDEISAAMDQSRAAGYVEGATTAMSNLPQPAPTIDTGSIVASQTASDAARAASDARAPAERAAESAQNAAANASSSVSTDTNTTP